MFTSPAPPSPGARAGSSRTTSRRLDLAVVLALCLIALGLMGPVAVHLNGALYGIGGDGYSGPEGAAQRLAALRAGGPFAPLPQLLGAPFPGPGGDWAIEPLYWYRGALLAFLLTPVGAINALIFAGLAGTAVALYLFLRRRGLPLAPAALGALVYGYCPIRLAEGQEHFSLLEGYWLVLECALLLRLAADGRARWAVALGLCLGLCELDSAYLGYCGALLAAGWFAVLLGGALRRGDWPAAGGAAGSGLLALAVLALVVAPAQLPLVLARGASSGYTIVRDLGDLDRLALRWWDFLLPSPDNPLLGPLGRAAFSAHLGVDTVSEQSTMVGYVALLLAGAALLASPRRGERPGERSLALTAVVAGILFGLPPAFTVGPLRLPTPPAFVHALLPQFRTTSRLDLLIQLGVAILAALGARRLLQGLGRPAWRRAAAAALALAVLLEYSDVPPWRHIDLLPAPPLDRWLAALPPQQAGIVAQYPIAASDQEGTPRDGFYAYAVHGHRLFNGVQVGTPPDALRLALGDPLNPAMPAAWAALGVRTLTIDDAYYRARFGNARLAWDGPGGLAAHLPPGLALRYRDAGDSGYAVTAAPAAVVAGLGAGFGAADLGPDGREWRWMGERATLWVDDAAARPARALLWTAAHNNGGAHALAVPGYLPVPVSAARAESAVALPLAAGPGMRPLELRADGGAAPLAGSGDRSPVAVQLRGLEPGPLWPQAVPFAQGGRPRWELTGAGADGCAAQPGSALDVALLWRVLAPTDGPRTVFLHLVGAAGDLAAQADGPPDGGAAPTDRTPAGAGVVDVHALALPATLPPGRYRLRAGMYDAAGGARLARGDGGGNTVELGAVTVMATSDGPERVSCAW